MCGGGDFNVDAYARMLPGFCSPVGLFASGLQGLWGCVVGVHTTLADTIAKKDFKLLDLGLNPVHIDGRAALPAGPW